MERTVSNCGCSGILVLNLRVMATYIIVIIHFVNNYYYFFGLLRPFIACWETGSFTPKLHKVCNWMVISWETCPDHRRGLCIFYNIASWSKKSTLNYYVYKVVAFIVCKNYGSATSRCKQVFTINIRLLHNPNYLKDVNVFVIFKRGSRSKSGILLKKSN